MGKLVSATIQQPLREQKNPSEEGKGSVYFKTMDGW